MTKAAVTPKRSGSQVPSIPVESYTLRCGAELLVTPRPGAPVCAAAIHIRGGHSLEALDKAGTAHLTGFLVDRGTQQRTEEEIAELLENSGGGIQGGSTGISASIEGSQWRRLLDLVAESLLTPSYPKEKFERERARLHDRLLVEDDDPRVQAMTRFRRLVYGDHWLGRSDYGTPASVMGLRRSDVARFHTKNWVAKRALIAFCGDVDPAALRRHLDKRLADWRPGAVLPAANQEFPEPAPRSSTFFAEREQVHVYLGHLGIRRSNPDFPALVTMDHVLGTGPGFCNRISRKLRDEQGLAYTVHAAISSSAGPLPGTFTAYIGTSPDKLEVAVNGMLHEMREIQAHKVSADELDLAKSYLTGAFVLGFERASRRVQHVTSARRNGLPFGYLEDLVQQISAVTVDDVQRVAQTYLHPERCALAVAGPVDERRVEQLVKPSKRRSAPKRRSSKKAAKQA